MNYFKIQFYVHVLLTVLNVPFTDRASKLVHSQMNCYVDMRSTDGPIRSRLLVSVKKKSTNGLLLGCVPSDKLHDPS